MTDQMPTDLWEPERHTKLLDASWDEGAARFAIDDIVADARSSFSAESLWPPHPNDGDAEGEVWRNLYFGAAGVVWALDYLAKAGACAAGERFGSAARGWLEPNRKHNEWFGGSTAGLLLGDTGILITQWRTRPASEVKDALAEAISATAHHPSLEFMWGSPGALVAALAMYDWTGEARWAELVRTCADALERSLMMGEEQDCRLWTQDLYGSKVKLLGAVHGFAGNAFALIACRRLLPTEQWARLSATFAESMSATAIRSGELVNWPASVGPPRPGRTALFLQHCHGAPGMVTALAGLDQPVDDLLIAAGETIWCAGPLIKGANLCHGTGGNGYAFLKLFERTGDQLWLERARRFAMHAIADSVSDAERFGRRRYSLWTGDLGLACYLFDCIEAKARFPTMDVL
jgi:lantibiotic modifying enzyme